MKNLGLGKKQQFQPPPRRDTPESIEEMPYRDQQEQHPQTSKAVRQPYKIREVPEKQKRVVSQEPSARRAPKAAVPKRHERNELYERVDRNLIKDNMHQVIHDNSLAVKARQKVIDKENQKKLPSNNKNYGKVPRYIDKYNQQREDAAIR